MKLKQVFLVFFLDAVRYDDIRPMDTPFLYEIAKKGMFGRLQTILAFDGIAPTIFTGTYPEVHGVWTQHLLAGKDGPYNWISLASPFLGRIDQTIEGSNLLWKAFRFAILKASLFANNRTYYPGINKVPFRDLAAFDFSLRRGLSEKNAFGSIPSLFDLLMEKGVGYAVADHSAFQTDQKVVQKVLQIKKPPEVVYVRLMDLDEASHSYGVFSQERRKGLANLDWCVHTVFNHFQHLGLDPVVVLFADHGFMNVTAHLDIMHHIVVNGVSEQDFTVFLDSTMARFWGDDETIEKISQALSDLKTGRILTDADLRYYHVPKSSRYGNLVFLADPGVVVLPNFYQGTVAVKGMHGYIPEIQDMHTVLLIYGNRIAPQRLSDAKLVDVLPTILDLLGISKPQNCAGSSKLD